MRSHLPNSGKQGAGLDDVNRMPLFYCNNALIFTK